MNTTERNINSPTMGETARPIQITPLQPQSFQGYSIFDVRFTTLTLFVLIVAYTAIPFLEVPFIGLSLSAPLFFLVALEVFFRPPRPWIERYKLWVRLAVFIWLGLLLSLLLNGLLKTGAEVNTLGILTVVRYGYWLLTFVVTVYLVSSADLGSRIQKAVVWAILATALLRWFEAIVWGKIGAWTSPRFFSQNMYGILFSTFTPFVLPNLLFAGSKKWISGSILLIVGIAAAINGSRGSWISMSIGLLVFMLLFSLGKKRGSKRITASMLLAGIILTGFLIAPEKIINVVSSRYATFQEIEQDKSYAIRQLMIQKGWRLFKENPVIGIGPGRWRQESTELDLPSILRYESQDHFDKKSSHNSYLSFLAEGGLVASIPFFILLLILAYLGFKSTLKLSANQQYWAIGVYAGFVSMSIHLWALAGLTGTTTWVIYGMVGAIIVSSRKINVTAKTVDKSRLHK